MAKARVNLKGVHKAADRLTKDLKNLRRKPAVKTSKREADTLHRKLTNIRRMIAECPDGLFRLFDTEGPTAAPRRRAKSGRKTGRKGTRKGR